MPQKPVTDLLGNAKPEHACSPRSPLAQATVRIVRLQDGDLVAWNVLATDLSTGSAVCFGLRYCPFCGVDLFGNVVKGKN